MGLQRAERKTSRGHCEHNYREFVFLSISCQLQFLTAVIVLELPRKARVGIGRVQNCIIGVRGVYRSKPRLRALFYAVGSMGKASHKTPSLL